MFTLFLLVRANSNWLALTRQQRGKLFADHVMHHLQNQTKIHMRYFDAEAFHAKISDIIVIETSDLKCYYFWMEALRDSPIFAENYFTLIDVIPSIENGFSQYEENIASIEV
ncbi:MAG: Darcynin 1 [Gammaproteobacteria bacterium]|nr:Darcynin 1 [Gammaproteobacteria bacterium]